jgi:hypothetical protein
MIFLAVNEDAYLSNKGFCDNERGQPVEIEYDSSEDEVSGTTEDACSSEIKQPESVKNLQVQ